MDGALCEVVTMPPDSVFATWTVIGLAPTDPLLLPWEPLLSVRERESTAMGPTAPLVVALHCAVWLS